MSTITANLGFSSGGDNPNQYLLFQVNDDTFCVNVNSVNQIEFYEKSFPIPSSPSYVVGVVKTRGKIVTLVHLGKRLNLNNKEPLKNSSHIIYIDKGNNRTIGMVVDRVTSLENIPKNLIQEDLDVINTDIPLDFLKGTITLEHHGIVILLNLDLVLSNFEVEDIDFKTDRLDTEISDLDQEDIDKFDLAMEEDLDFGSDKDDDDDLFPSISESGQDANPSSNQSGDEAENSKELNSNDINDDELDNQIEEKVPEDEDDEFFDNSFDEEE